MSNLRLYRGITVSDKETDSIIDDIKTNGLDQNEKQSWDGFIWKNLKKDIDALYQKEDLKRADTAPASKWVKTKDGGHIEYIEGEKSICFADKTGAEYYAIKHNVTKCHTAPLLITVDIEIENIVIDGRDFLYTVFSLLNPKDLAKTKRQSNKLKGLYGNKIEYYIEKIIKHPNSEKNAICDLVIFDNEIIIEHYTNKKVIGGRFNTIFKSAFCGKVPILPNQIINVERLPNVGPSIHPDIILNDILEK